MSREEKEPPERRRGIRPEKKMEISDKPEAGRAAEPVTDEYGIDDVAVYTTKQTEDALRKTPGNKQMCLYERDDLVEETEKILLTWVEENSEEEVKLDSNSIRCKALDIFNDLKRKRETAVVPDFNASQEWFEGFKKRHSLFGGEILPIETPDEKSAREYPVKLSKIIKGNAYFPEQVFNADETGLFWKKILRKMYILKMERLAWGCGEASNSVSVILCSNASGDLIMRPLLIRTCQRPSEKARVTNASLSVPEAGSYLAENNEFKVLLLLDAAPGRSALSRRGDVRIEFLPPTASALIQPQNRGVISVFKASYVTQEFADILGILDRRLATEHITMLNCATNAFSTAADVRKSTSNPRRKVVRPEVVAGEGSSDGDEAAKEAFLSFMGLPLRMSVPAYKTVLTEEVLPAFTADFAPRKYLLTCNAILGKRGLSACSVTPAKEADASKKAASSYEADVPVYETEAACESVSTCESIRTCNSDLACKADSFHNDDDDDDDDDDPAYEADLACEADPDLEAAAAFEDVPSYEPVRTYKAASTYVAIPVDEAVPTYRAGTACGAIQTYDAVPTYEVVPAYEDDPGYEVVPAYEAEEANSLEVEDVYEPQIENVEGSYASEEGTLSHFTDVVNEDISEASLDSCSNFDYYPTVKFDEDTIARGIRRGLSLQSFFLRYDPDSERSMKFHMDIKTALDKYANMYKNAVQTRKMTTEESVRARGTAGSLDREESTEDAASARHEYDFGDSDSDIENYIPRRRGNATAYGYFH